MKWDNKCCNGIAKLDDLSIWFNRLLGIIEFVQVLLGLLQLQPLLQAREKGILTSSKPILLVENVNRHDFSGLWPRFIKTDFLYYAL